MKIKGHWPRGRRRNDPGVSPAQLRRLLKAFLRFKAGKGYSYRMLEEEFGRNQRTLRRWISGEDWPTAEDIMAIRRFMDAPKNSP
jgi:hypothetical protein